MSLVDRRPRQRQRGARLTVWLVTAGLSGLVLSAAATVAAVPAAAGRQSGVISPIAEQGTPELAPTGVTEQVRELVPCHGTMYAVGSFTEISQNGVVYSRDNIFSFSATPPFTITTWNPDVNGRVNAIAFARGSCSDAYIGGAFTSVHGTTAKNIAEISTFTGAVVRAFGHHAYGGPVFTLASVDGRHLLVGGSFTTINGSTADPYMASLSLITGQDDGFLDLHISGNISYPGVRPNSTEIYNQQLSHSRKLDLVEGDFTSVDGLPRQQIFMLNLGARPVTATGWSSPEWDGSDGNVPGGYPYQCSDAHPFYIHAAAWSPDDSTIYIASTGFHPWNEPVGSYPRSGLCDAVAAFPATQTEVTHEWINYTGCDSLYSVAASATTVYVGGHERWADNPEGCNFAGTGAIASPGMGAFRAADGSLVENYSRTEGRYKKARGKGADDVLLTGAGLWIASDDFDGSNMCGHTLSLAGICFLPYQ